MGSMRVLIPLVFLLLASFVAVGTEAAMDCNATAKNFLPCADLFYPPDPDSKSSCCNGLRKLNELCSTPTDSQAVCGCVKPVLANMVKLPPDYLEAIATYPGRCGVNLPFKLELSFDCNSLK